MNRVVNCGRLGVFILFIAMLSTGSAARGTGDTASTKLLDAVIPVLCYHQVRDWRPTDSKNARVYITPVATFSREMELLRVNGYSVILPEQLVAHIRWGARLPANPVLLTFDDGTTSQFENALTLLERMGFKATFFIMTVSLGRDGFMSKGDVAKLAEKGHVIGCHTWDHHKVTTYTESDWEMQVEKPRNELQRITGRPVKYFAYPYGVWDTTAVARLKRYGFDGAFRLWGKADNRCPAYAIRRILVSGNWTPEQMISEIKKVQHTSSCRNSVPCRLITIKQHID